MYRDQYGVVIQEGDFVAFPLALGQVVRGQIVKLDSGLTLSRNPNELPPSFAHVLLMIDMQAAPNGVVMGLIKTERPPDAPPPKQPAQQVPAGEVPTPPLADGKPFIVEG